MLNVIVAVVSALVGLGILILVHEFGHFIVAKKTGVGVLTFSLGFGPKLFRKKVGETEYALSAFPLGGYVKMVGEDPEEEVQAMDVRKSFSHQGLAKRAAIVFAGPLFNLILAVVIFCGIFMAFGAPVLSTRVAGVEPGSPAAQAGLQKGDRILAVNGETIRNWEELSTRIRESQGNILKLRVQKSDREVEVPVQPTRRAVKNVFEEEKITWAIGIISEVTIEKSSPWRASWQAVSKTWEYSVLTLVALYKMVLGDVSPKNLGGPLLIAQMAGQQAREGLINFLFFIAVLSINLGVLNLLPIPVLDGGHLLFFLIESVIGRPVKVKYRERAQQVGIFLLILVMIYAFYNDIARFFDGP